MNWKEKVQASRAVWEAYAAAKRRRAEKIAAALEAAVKVHPLPEGWRLVPTNTVFGVELQQWRWIPDIAGGDIFAHGEDVADDEPTGEHGWVRVHPSQAPEDVADILKKIEPALQAAEEETPEPQYPALAEPQAFIDEAWRRLERALWVEAAHALSRRDYRTMRELAARAREAGAGSSKEDLPDEAQLQRADQVLQALPYGASDRAREAVLAEMRRFGAAQREARLEQERAAQRELREQRERRADDVAPVGGLITVVQPYSLRKRAPDVGLIRGAPDFYVRLTSRPEGSGTIVVQARVVERKTAFYQGKRTIAVVDVAS
ncbi:MAG: hypothetical protein N2690_05455 [Rhodocyclaceae bacterium]|nr:hypothetical protein [Rhodocyclaceae bacterium]